MRKKSDLKLTEYFWVLLALVVTTAVLIVAVNYFIYSKNFAKEIEARQKHSAESLVKKFDESVSYIDNLTSLVAKRISKRGAARYFVASLLEDTKPKIDDASDSIFSWTLFDFVTPNGYVVANSVLGVLDKPVFVSEDKKAWITSARVEPWKLQFSKKDIGITSHQPIIPLGFGVTDTTGRFLGIISLGINIDRLEMALQAAIPNQQTRYALFDENYSTILFSENFTQKKLGALEQYLSSYQRGMRDGDYFVVNGQKFHLEKSKLYPFWIVVGDDENLLRGEFRSKFLPNTIDMVCLVMFFIVLLYFFKKRFLQPVTQLASASRKISKKQFDVLVPSAEIYELNLLSDAVLNVKQLLKKEEDLQAQIKSDNQKDRKEHIHKNDFLSAAAHDLKNLIAGVMGIAELIRFNLNEKAKLSEIKFNKDELVENLDHLNDLDECSSDLLDFINDLLDINQASIGDFRIIEESEVNLTELTRRSIALLETRANKARQRFIYDINKNSPALIAHNLDSRRIKQILVTLLSNSIKYSKENRKIEIKIERLGSEESEKSNNQIVENIHNNQDIDEKHKHHLLHLVSKRRNEGISRIAITIKDQGFGMDKDEIKIALTKYGAVKSQNTGLIDSTGLSLPLIKHLVEAQGGLLEIKSERGVGTEIKLVF